MLKIIAVLQPCTLYLLGRRLQLSSATNERLEVRKMMNAMTLYFYHFVNLRVPHRGIEWHILLPANIGGLERQARSQRRDQTRSWHSQEWPSKCQGTY
jgi:hypothetical protein